MGISMIVGMRIFSIVGDLGFVFDQIRGFEQLLLEGQGLHLLRRRRKLEGEGGR